MKHKFDRDF